MRLSAQLDGNVRPSSADSLNSTPLLATMPTGWPWMRAKPVTSVLPYLPLEFGELAPQIDDQVMTSCTS
jgi:hypothetical protein